MNIFGSIGPDFHAYGYEGLKELLENFDVIVELYFHEATTVIIVSVPNNTDSNDGIALILVVINELVDDLIDGLASSLDPGSHRARGVHDNAQFEHGVIAGHVEARFSERNEVLFCFLFEVGLNFLTFVARVLVLGIDHVDLEALLHVGQALVLGVDD